MVWIVKMPKLGQTMESGVVRQWLKKTGEPVAKGDLLVVIESEKFVEEVEAREEGVLRKILVQVGEEVRPGSPIGLVAAPHEPLPSLEDSSATTRMNSLVRPPDEIVTFGREVKSGKVKASPAAKRLAREKQVDLSQVTGSGPGQSVTVADVEAFLAAGRQERGSEGPVRSVASIRKTTPWRRTVAERLKRSYREAVHVTLYKKIDLSVPLRKCDLQNGSEPLMLSIVDFIIEALLKTLEEHAEFNAIFEDNQHRLIRERNLSLAVDSPQGLLTPVLHEADRKDLFEVARARKELIEKALHGKCTREELSGGTFTVTNLGPYGIDSFSPIINPPQVAILGIGRVQTEAVQDKGGSVSFRPHVVFSLSLDHRVLDGADGARFLKTFEACLSAG